MHGYSGADHGGGMLPLRSSVARAPPRKLDLHAIQIVAVDGLPERERWIIDGASLDFDFGQARRGLRRITSNDVVGGVIPPEWLNLLVFGEYDYDGGAHPWIAVRASDGTVCGLDVEGEDETAVFLFNSSIGPFVQTFAALSPYLGQDKRLPGDIGACIQAIDPQVYPVSEWRLLIEHLTAA